MPMGCSYSILSMGGIMVRPNDHWTGVNGLFACGEFQVVCMAQIDWEAIPPLKF